MIFGCELVFSSMSPVKVISTGIIWSRSTLLAGKRRKTPSDSCFKPADSLVPLRRWTKRRRLCFPYGFILFPFWANERPRSTSVRETHVATPAMLGSRGLPSSRALQPVTKIGNYSSTHLGATPLNSIWQLRLLAQLQIDTTILRQPVGRRINWCAARS